MILWDFGIFSTLTKTLMTNGVNYNQNFMYHVIEDLILFRMGFLTMHRRYLDFLNILNSLGSTPVPFSRNLNYKTLSL